MGYEYQLRFTHPGASTVAEVVRRLPFAHERQPQSGEFELWIDGPDGGMPDAVAQVESYGLYFCYYGVAGRELLGTLLAKLTSEFDAVTIAELDESITDPAPGTPALSGCGGAKRQIVAAGNTIVPAYLALLQKGYRVRREETAGSTEWWRAEGPECILIAEDPETLLGLAAMYETRGPDWGASDAEIEAFLERFPQADD